MKLIKNLKTLAMSALSLVGVVFCSNSRLDEQLRTTAYSHSFYRRDVNGVDRECNNKNEQTTSKSNKFARIFSFLNWRGQGEEAIRHYCLTSKCAFTLTEVLVALTVVGVVSALTVPMLWNRHTAKALSAMRSSVKLAMYDTLDMYLTNEGKSNLLATDMREADGVREYLTTYYRVKIDCANNRSKCFADNYTDAEGATHAYPDDMSCIKSNDGATICMTPLTAERDGDIFVDVNATQGPNVLGKDIFLASYDNRGYISEPGGDLVDSEYVLIVRSGNGIASVSPERALLSRGTTQQIDITTNEGWDFNTLTRVRGNCTVSGTSVTMGDEECRVLASAVSRQYTITLDKGSCISISPSGTLTRDYGSSVSVTATPEDGGAFVSWSGCTAGSNPTATFNVTNSCALTASCSAAPRYTLTVVKGTGIDSASATKTQLKSGDTATINYVMKSGYTYPSLKVTGGNCTLSDNTVKMGTNNCTVRVDADQDYTLTVNNDGCENVSGGGTFAPNSEQIVSATAKKNINGDFGSLEGVTKNNGSCTLLDNNHVIMGSGNCSVTAHCSPPPADKYKLTVNNSGCKTAGISDGGTSMLLESGDTKSVYAIKPDDNDDYIYADPVFRASGCSLNGTTVTMKNSNCNVNAICSSQKKQYTINVSTSTCVGVTGAGTYDKGATVTLSALFDEGAALKSWSGCGISGISDSVVSFEATESCSATATCGASELYRTLSASADDVGYISVGKALQYVEPKGKSDTITASPKEGSGAKFSNWVKVSGDCSIDDPESPVTRVTMEEEDCSIHANFNRLKLSVTSENPSLTVDPTLAFVQANGSQTVKVQSEATNYYYADAWKVMSGNCMITNAGLSEATVTMKNTDCNVMVTASNKKYKYSVNHCIFASGTVVKCGVDVIKTTEGFYYPGEEIPIELIPGISGYEFLKWYLYSSDICSVENVTAKETVVTTGKGDCDVKAYFNDLDTRPKISVYAFPLDYGKTNPNIHDVRYNPKDEFEISFTPNDGYTFTNWEVYYGGDCKVENYLSISTKLTVGNKNCIVVAHSVEDSPETKPHNLAVYPYGGGGNTAPNARNLSHKLGDTISAEATPDYGYKFSTWNNIGNCKVSDTKNPNITITMGSTDCSVWASFVSAEHKITTIAFDGGTVNPGGVTSVKEGATLEVTAKPEAGYWFSSWGVSGGCTISDKNASKITVTQGTSDCIVFAEFKENPTFSVLSIAGGTVHPSEPLKLAEGDKIDISVTELQDNYTFTKWNVFKGHCTINDATKTSTSVIMGDVDCYVYPELKEENNQLLYIWLEIQGIARDVKDIIYQHVKVGDQYALSLPTLADGYYFKKWSSLSGSCSIQDLSSEGTSVTIVGMDDCYVYPSLEQMSEIIMSEPTGGTITSTNKYGKPGDSITITATDGDGTFEQWISYGDCTILDPTNKVTSVTLGVEVCYINASFNK